MKVKEIEKMSITFTLTCPLILRTIFDDAYWLKTKIYQAI
jgi:hypothetical protein